MTDLLVRNPVRMQPALALNDEGMLTIVLGTGNENVGNPGSNNKVFSLDEILNVDLLTGEIGEVESHINWQTSFETMEVLTGPPIVFNRIAYFTTYVADKASACFLGNGRVWGVHYNKTDPDTNTLWGQFLDSDGNKALYVELENTMPSGLTLMQRPSCENSPEDQEPSYTFTSSEMQEMGPGNIKTGELELVIQTGNAETDPTKKPAMSTEKQIVQT